MDFFVQRTNTVLPDGSTPDGYFISVNTRSGKKNTQESDFFPDGTEIQIKIEELKILISNYFNSQP